MLRHTLIMLTGLALSAVASAEVYTWVDDHGQVYYSDKPLDPAAHVTAVHSEPTDPARVEAERQRLQEQNAARAEQQALAIDDTRKAEDQATLRAENCRRSRERLGTILSAQRPYRVQADGERHYLSSEEIDAERETAQAAVEKWCNG